MSTTIQDHQFMAEAIRLAERGLYTTDPNPRVGCVITQGTEVVGRGWHVRTGEPHAEINALQDTGKNAAGGTAYVTLEPCCHHGRTPPCSDALIKNKISRVVIGMADPNPNVSGNGIQQLVKAGIEVEVGLLEQQAQNLNPGFIKRMRTGCPYVRSKLAMSLDGRTAMADGESKWITSSEAREDVHRWRARSSAIVTGVGTILADDPSMTARIEENVVMPLRVIVDTNLSTPLSAKILKQPGSTIVMTCSDDDDAIEQLQSAGAKIIQIARHHNMVNLAAVMDKLGEMEINEVLLETGATLSGAMLEQGLIDEMIFYMAPSLLGDEARGLFRLPAIKNMSDRIELTVNDIRPVGRDWRISVKVTS
jgi:diaminohydroxyphosphoribosylaminopyrimidine deaminase/5-amino-6-(5-phosphoribosylamino)uracil reductase